MRNYLGKWITENVNLHDDIYLLSGDIGFGIFDEFRKQYPHKFLNCGIAEQNMIGTAAGLAAAGFRPIVYTIIPFLIYRPYEFIRNLIAHQNLPVILVGVGGGYSYDKLGYTHYAVEDIALVKTLQNVEIYTPFDPISVGTCLTDAYLNKGPSYIRLMKGGEPCIPCKDLGGMSSLLNLGNDYKLYCYGSISTEALEACKILQEKHKILGEVIAVWKISSASKRINFSNKTSFFIEEHIQSGLFSNFGANEEQIYTLQKNLAPKVGARADLLDLQGLSGPNIAKRISKHFT